jgi:hypothetical protein
LLLNFISHSSSTYFFGRIPNWWILHLTPTSPLTKAKNHNLLGSIIFHMVWDITLCNNLFFLEGGVKDGTTQLLEVGVELPSLNWCTYTLPTFHLVGNYHSKRDSTFHPKLFQVNWIMWPSTHLYIHWKPIMTHLSMNHNLGPPS